MRITRFRLAAGAQKAAQTRRVDEEHIFEVNHDRKSLLGSNSGCVVQVLPVPFEEFTTSVHSTGHSLCRTRCGTKRNHGLKTKFSPGQCLVEGCNRAHYRA